MRQPPATSSSRWGSLLRISTLSLIAFLCVVPHLSAAVYYVSISGDDNRSPAEAESPGTPLRTITRALEFAQSGDTISVGAGTYAQGASPAPPGEAFPLRLIEGVAIIGEDPATTFLTPPSDRPAFVNSAEALTAATRISGFTITDAGGTGTVAALMIFVPAEFSMAPTIDGNVFDGNGSGVGIAVLGEGLGGSFTATISGNDFRRFGTGTGTEPQQTPLEETAIAIISGGSSMPLAGDTLSPVISNNQFSDNSQAIAVGEFEMLVAKGEAAVRAFDSMGTIAPSIQYNSFLENTIDVWLQWFGGSVATFAPTVIGNDSTGPLVSIAGIASGADKGVAAEMSFDSSKLLKKLPARTSPPELVKRLQDQIAPRSRPRPVAMSKDVRAAAWDNTFAPTISQNVVNNAEIGSVFLYHWMYPTDSLVIDLAITDNILDGGVGFFVVLFIEEEINEVADTIRIEGNMITGSAEVVEGPPGNVLVINRMGLLGTAKSRALAAANDVRIAGNHIEGVSEFGLAVASNNYSTRPFVIECNTITGNGFGAEATEPAGFIQESQTDPVADLGGGGFSSGGNNIYGNDGFELINRDTDPLSAENNYWGVTTSVAIDAVIFDDDESGAGAVDFEPFLSTVSACAVLSSSDISLVKSGAASVVAGGQITYTLTATNNGPDAATNVVLTDTLPGGTTFVSASAGCVHALGVVTCTAPGLASGAQMIVTITVTAPLLEGEILNSATAAADGVDPVATNNASQVLSAVIPEGAQADIPALSDWALAVLALLLMSSAVWVIGRQGM